MRVVCGCLWLVFFLSAAAWGQEPPAEGAQNQPADDSPAAQPPVADPPASDEPGESSAAKNPPATEPVVGNPDAPEVKEFYKQFEEFKAIVQRMRDLQREYRVVRPTGREELEKEFQDKMVDSRQRFDKLQEAALTAFKANPADADIADFLGASALNAGESGFYETAITRLSSLAEQGYLPNVVADPLGRFAFLTSDYDTAEKYLKHADEAKNITTGGREYLSRIAEERAWWAEELASRERDAAGDPLPQVRLKTTQGDVLIELFENDAPNTVANFITLVEQGYYDDLPFSLIQPGIRASTGVVPPNVPKPQLDYTIAHEGHGDKFRRHFRGSVSLDLPPGGNKDGGCAEFSIFLRPERMRDPNQSETGAKDGQTVFGRVVEGMEALQSMAPFDKSEGRQPIEKVIDAEVVRKREHPYDVQKFEPAKSTESQPGEESTPADPAKEPADPAKEDEPAKDGGEGDEDANPAPDDPAPDDPAKSGESAEGSSESPAKAPEQP